MRNKKTSTFGSRCLAAALSSLILMSAVSPLTALAAAGGTPIQVADLTMANQKEALKCSVLFPYINGDDVVGQTLTGKYTMSINGQTTYKGQEGVKDQSAYQWFSGSSRNGEYAPIEGETARSYTIQEGDVNRYLRFQVTPAANGMTGEAILSDPVGPVMTQQEFDRIQPRLTKEGTYLGDRNQLTNEVNTRFQDAVYFTVDTTIGGGDNTKQTLLNGSSYYCKGGVRADFEQMKPTVADGRIMVNRAFAQTLLETEFDFGANELAPLDEVAASAGKQVYYATDEISKGANGNYRSTAIAEGLVLLTDGDPGIDVVADRDVLNEMTNQLYDLRATEEEMEWFRDGKFGMFIHWDPGTMSGKEIGWGRGTGARKVTYKVPDYDLSYQDFDPEELDAPAIAAKAKEMGCEYLVFTSKHHGGFKSWNTNYFPEHSIASTPYAEDRTAEEFDIIKQLADAFHAEGLKFGLYYSPQDWYNDYCFSSEHYRWMETYLGQLTELMGNYGEIDLFWCDAIGTSLATHQNPAPDGYTERSVWSAWDPRTVLRRVKQLQPGILTNDRYAYRWEDPKPWDDGALPYDIQGDFVTPEQKTASFTDQYDWESCLTIDGSNGWSYNSDTEARDPQVVVSDIVKNACNNGNVLLNIGMMPNGQFSNKHLAAFEQVGDWMNAYGDAVYNTRGGPYVHPYWGGSTFRTNGDGTTTVFLHVAPGVNDAAAIAGSRMTIPASPDGLVYHTASLAGQPDAAVSLERNEDGGYTITLPKGKHFAQGNGLDDLDTIIQLDQDAGLAVQDALEAAQLQLAGMESDAYPQALKPYRAVLEQKADALRAAQEGECSEQFSQLKEFQTTLKTAQKLNDQILKNETLIGERVVGDQLWELTQVMKETMSDNLAAAKSLLSRAATEESKLESANVALILDQQYLDSLFDLAKVTATPTGPRIHPSRKITLSTINSALEIRYTLDGSEPTAESALYEGTITPGKQGAFTLKAATFSDGKATGPVTTQLYAVDNALTPANLVLGRPALYAGQEIDELTDGSANTDYSFEGAESLDLVFDLGKEKEFNNLYLSENYYIGNTEVREVEVQYSNDGAAFEMAASAYIMSEGVVSFDAVRARYIRIHLGNCRNPIIKEVELYNSLKPDYSSIKLSADSKQFFPGKTVGFSVSGEVGEKPVTAEDVVFSVQPAEAGVFTGNQLAIRKEFTGSSIKVTAQRDNGDLTIYSNSVSLAVTQVGIAPNKNLAALMEVTLSNPFEDVEIRYTVDGSEPTGRSFLYQQPFPLPYETTSLKAAFYQDGKQLGVVASLPCGPANIAPEAAAEASSEMSAGVAGEKAVDGNPSTLWGVAAEATEATLTLTFAEPVEVKRSDLTYSYMQYQGTVYNDISRYSVEYWKDGAWETAFESQTLTPAGSASKSTAEFEPVQSEKFRLHILEGKGIKVSEFSLTPVAGKSSVADRTGMNQALNEAEAALSDGRFDAAAPDRQQAFTMAYTLAKQVNETMGSTQQAVTEYAAKLLKAVDGLYTPANTQNLTYYLSVAQTAQKNGLADKLISSVKTRFLAAVDAAKTLLEQERPSQAQVDAAAAELRTVINLLSMTAGDKALLQTAVDSLAQIDPDDYDDEQIVEDYNQAVDRAEQVLADGDALQQDVDDALASLLDAIETLHAAKKDWRALQDLILDGENSILPDIQAGSYVDDGVSGYRDAFEAAKQVMKDKASGQDRIDRAADALRKAAAALRFKANKETLDGLIRRAEGIDTAQYTPETVQAFLGALQAAKAVNDDQSLSTDDQQAVDQAAAALETAMDGLVRNGDAASTGTTATPATGERATLPGLASLLLIAGAFICIRKRSRRA